MLSITAYHFQNSQALRGARRKIRCIPTTTRLSSRTNAKFSVTRYRERHRDKNQSAEIGDGLGLFRTTAAATRHLTIVATRSCVAAKVNHNGTCIPLEYLGVGFPHLSLASSRRLFAKAFGVAGRRRVTYHFLSRLTLHCSLITYHSSL